VLLFAAVTLMLARAQTLPCAEAGSRPNKNTKPDVDLTPLDKTVKSAPMATFEGAVDSALETAQAELSRYLKDQNLPVLWQPTPAFIREHLLADVAAEDEETGWSKKLLNNHEILVRETKPEEVGHNDVGIDAAYQVKLRVNVGSRELASIRQEDERYRDQLRHQIAQGRQLWLGKVLLGVIALLAAVSGYIRLEDATKGYYTGLLRLALVGIACAVGVGIWLTC
jgi:hypothetical protein